MSVTLRVRLSLLYLSLGALVSAATVSVLLFESGVEKDVPSIEASSAWESGVLDGFFEAGHIVSNAETVRLESPGLPSISIGLVEAREGGADFIIHILLDYDGTDNGHRSPRSVAYRICDKQGTIFFQGEKGNLAVTNNGAEDETNGRDIARILIGRMKKGR